MDGGGILCGIGDLSGPLRYQFDGTTVILPWDLTI